MAESVGRWLPRQKLGAGARVAILADNHPRWVAAYLGTIALGLHGRPARYGLSRRSGSKAAEGQRRFAALLRRQASGDCAAGGLRTPGGPRSDRSGKLEEPMTASRVWIGDLDSIFAAGPGEFHAVDAPAENVAALLYTSGTTADPKGVMLTHANLLGEVNAVFVCSTLGQTMRSWASCPCSTCWRRWRICCCRW